MSTWTRALLTLQARGQAPCFYTPHGDPLFVLPHLADLVHHHDEHHVLVDVDAYRAYTTAHPGALPEIDLSTCTPVARATGVTYTYRFWPPTQLLPACPIPGTRPARSGVGASNGTGPADTSPIDRPGDDDPHGQAPHVPDSRDDGPGDDGLRLGITITNVREHPLLGAFTMPITGRAGLYTAAARCCRAVATDLAAHPTRARHRQLVEFLEPSWWHAHAETFTTWAQHPTRTQQHSTGQRPCGSQSLAWRQRRRRELSAAITAESLQAACLTVPVLHGA